MEERYSRMSEATEEPFLARLTTEARSLLGFLLMLSGDRHLADDLFQDTCLEAWRHQDRYVADQPFGAWVRGIARNVTLRHWRSAGRERSASLAPEVMEQLADAWEPEDPVIAKERVDALRACLDGLAPDHRTVIGQRYEQDWSHQRISQDSGRSTDAVKMLVMRLKRVLKDCVERRLGQRAVSLEESERKDGA